MNWQSYTLNFRFEAGTSRGILKKKNAFFIKVLVDGEKIGIGECCVLSGLSYDDKPGFLEKLEETCVALELASAASYSELQQLMVSLGLEDWPSIKMGVETAFLDIWNGGRRVIFDNDFIRGEPIPINGLIWMGKKEFMLEQIQNKLAEGYTTLKMKIGAIDFESELAILKFIRSKFGPRDISIRVDANGAFKPEESLFKLEQISQYHVHSIEQPLTPGLWHEMASLCINSPIPIALDEELIGLLPDDDRCRMLDTIKPQYIILKPSLLGGFQNTDKWIKLADQRSIGWWITSALESNIGLNAIAQYTYGKRNKMEQGLGTGQLFENNFPSPLRIKRGCLHYDPLAHWDLSLLDI